MEHLGNQEDHQENRHHPSNDEKYPLPLGTPSTGQRPTAEINAGSVDLELPAAIVAGRGRRKGPLLDVAHGIAAAVVVEGAAPGTVVLEGAAPGTVVVEGAAPGTVVTVLGTVAAEPGTDVAVPFPAVPEDGSPTTATGGVPVKKVEAAMEAVSTGVNRVSGLSDCNDDPPERLTEVTT